MSLKFILLAQIMQISLNAMMAEFDETGLFHVNLAVNHEPEGDAAY